MLDNSTNEYYVLNKARPKKGSTRFTIIAESYLSDKWLVDSIFSYKNSKNWALINVIHFPFMLLKFSYYDHPIGKFYEKSKCQTEQ